MIEDSVNMVVCTELTQLNNQPLELITLKNMCVLAISSSAIALYKNRSVVDDPLGNGLICYDDLPVEYRLSDESAPWVVEHSAGYVGLNNGCAVLILPNHIRLYQNKEAALRNKECMVELALPKM